MRGVALPYPTLCYSPMARAAGNIFLCSMAFIAACLFEHPTYIHTYIHTQSDRWPDLALCSSCLGRHSTLTWQAAFNRAG